MNSVQEAVNAPIKLTQNAINEVKKLIQTQNLDESHGLRIGVEGGGCSGMSYALGFDNYQEGDQIYDIEGIKVYMKKAHLMYLMGTEIDHQDGLNARGFIFNNPNASSTCGCGTSFGV
jgi:iron-sulfur cluster assembly protein